MESWLRTRLTNARTGHLAAAAGLLFAASVALVVTFWAVYLVIYFGFDWLFPHSHTARLWISLAVLLFVGNATADRRHLESFSFTTGTFYDKPVHIDVPFLGGGSTINPLAPDSAHSFVKFIANILCLGPRLATGAVRGVGRARRLSGVDAEGCAAVLAFLAKKEERVPFPEVMLAIPAGHDVVAILTQLQEIDGVMFLKSEPAGLSLESGLRGELRRFGTLPPARRRPR